ncbi:MAG: LuxR C-terminal-related transcriptional regulator [Dehalococcoidia bacterium]
MAGTFDPLTPREREVLALLAAGKTNGDISRELGISFPTAKAHVSSIIGKLGATSREDAVRQWTSIPRSRPRARFGFAPLFLVALAVASAAAVVAVRILFVESGDNTRPDEIRFPLEGIEVSVPRHEDVSGLGTSPYGEPLGIWLVRNEDGTVRAFFDRDPHTGCSMPWNPDYDLGQLLGDPSASPGAFKAYCGGWVFLLTGEIVFGASPRGLDEFPARIDGNEVVVDFRELRLGPCAEPQSRPDCSTATDPRMVKDIPPPIIPDWGHRTPAAGDSAKP